MKLRKLPKEIVLKDKNGNDIVLDIFSAIEYFYSLGYTDMAVAGIIGYSISRWNEILHSNSKGIVKKIQEAKERGIAKHQQRIIQKLETIISSEKFNDADFLLKYLKSKYPSDYVSENNRIVVEFVEPKK